jgi:hypothetical protein
MQKVALVAFQGEAMCFFLVLLNTLDMQQQGLTVKIIIEGMAVKLPPELNQPDQVGCASAPRAGKRRYTSKGAPVFR